MAGNVGAALRRDGLIAGRELRALRMPKAPASWRPTRRGV